MTGARSVDDLLANTDRQSAAFVLAARNRPWSDVHVDPDVVYGTTGIPLAVFNGATNARFEPATADDRIEAVLQPFRDGRIDMTWVVGPTSTPGDLVERLVAHGLTIDEAAPVMACPLAGWSSGLPAPGIETMLVVDDAGFQTAMEIMFAGFELPATALPMVIERYADFAIGPDATQRVFLAHLDGQPVATALGFDLDGVVGIYNVATLAEARRRGAGRSVMSAVLTDAADRGSTDAILESSEVGRSMYEGLGFREIGRVTVLLGAFGSTTEADPA